LYSKNKVGTSHHAKRCDKLSHAQFALGRYWSGREWSHVHAMVSWWKSPFMGVSTAPKPHEPVRENHYTGGNFQLYFQNSSLFICNQVSDVIHRDEP